MSTMQVAQFRERQADVHEFSMSPGGHKEGAICCHTALFNKKRKCVQSM